MSHLQDTDDLEQEREREQERARADVEQLSRLCLARGLNVVTAESCTGGLVATLCTSQPGSSRWFQGALITYQTQAKIHWLQVSPALIEQYGVVSEAVAVAMAKGALSGSSANLAVALTGIAGPGGGSTSCPVGNVWTAWAQTTEPGHPPQQLITQRRQFSGNREQIRLRAAAAAIKGLIALVNTPVSTGTGITARSPCFRA